MIGRRIGEVIRRLKVSDIDFTQGLVNFFIEKRKNPTYQLLAIPEILLQELKIYIEKNNLKQDDFVWYISRQRVDQIIKSISTKIGLLTIGSGKYNKLHAHLFRHSFAIQASKVLKNPADLIQLKNILAHSRIETTMFYLKFNPTEQKELLKEMFK
jgi:integrase